MTEPIRVLQVVASLNAGGMENYIMNLYRMVDKSKVQFDFVVHHAAVGLYEDEIQELGGKIYHFTVLDDKNVVKYISELNRFFDEHKEYQIIHGHLSSLEGLPVTGIEAQYSGLPCFFSDEVTREVKICSDTKFLKIGNENLGLWVDAISQQRINKERNKIELITKKFDIRTAAKSMEKRYIDLWKQSNS